ncbi:MAG: sigma-70 family RNA polymerase sigma factor [Chloroflexi bacterium]|nr:sigma-70 family RNA polymerase sigma factor [Chloroflexota bacterium]
MHVLLQEDAKPVNSEWFATTPWSVVLAAGRESSPQATAALESLCRTYWYPLYAYVRRRGFGPEDAQDFVQEFFRRLLASDWLARADQSKGRFRTFLLCGLQNFLANERQKAKRLQRGAGCDLIALDALEAVERYLVEPADVASADKLFERRWALTLLDHVLGQLQAEQMTAGAGERFKALRGVLLGEPTQEGYAALARRFGVTESTAKSWVHRLRRRYRELLREEVAQTVGSAGEVEDELRHLFRVLAS